jgi:hypothetical protein
VPGTLNLELLSAGTPTHITCEGGYSCTHRTVRRRPAPGAQSTRTVPQPSGFPVAVRLTIRSNCSPARRSRQTPKPRLSLHTAIRRRMPAQCNLPGGRAFPCAGDHWVLRQGRLSSYNSDTIRGGFPGFGFTILSVIVTSVVGGAIYYGLVFRSLLIRLSRYHFKLYAADPSSSEVIHHLSGVLTRFLYVAAMLGASGTLITAFPGR